MRYLILSDIHSNWDALEAVLSDTRGSYQKILCCGDLVGYGADPNRVVEWARSAVEVTVRGNHDKACCLEEELEWFNPVARAATLWTIRTLTPENLEFLRRLPQGPVEVDAFQLAHGSPADEDEYVITAAEATRVRDRLSAPLTFFGHTHIQGGFVFVRRAVKAIRSTNPASGFYEIPLEGGHAYLINPGSVGQPRDQDPRAAYAIYDSQAQVVEMRRTAYDIQGAQESILRAGLPPLLAHRLALGR